VRADAQLADISATLTKASAEIATEIQNFQEQLAIEGIVLTPALRVSLTNFEAIAQELDAINPAKPAATGVVPVPEEYAVSAQ
jgi:hypothetical protein